MSLGSLLGHIVQSRNAMQEAERLQQQMRERRAIDAERAAEQNNEDEKFIAHLWDHNHWSVTDRVMVLRRLHLLIELRAEKYKLTRTPGA